MIAPSSPPRPRWIDSRPVDIESTSDRLGSVGWGEGVFVSSSVEAVIERPGDHVAKDRAGEGQYASATSSLKYAAVADPMTTYLDNAATTMPAPEVIEAVAQTMRDCYGNPSSLHGLGAAAARALGRAREEVAALIHAQPEEIVFTGSGTEANALGLLGATRVAPPARGHHLVASGIEHAAVYHSARRLASEGWQLGEVAPGKDGRVTVESVLAAVLPETSVVAIMLVNNEIGTVQPVADIARALHSLGRKIHLHVDAVQFAGLLPVDVRTKGADSLAISAHKLHGPKGVGALWLRRGKNVASLYGGGGQERDLRSGTENVPACVGFGVAASLARGDGGARARVTKLRDQLEALIFGGIPAAQPVVPVSTERAPHISGILLPGLPAEPVLHALEARSIFASEGAACSSRAREQSRVLRALGVPASTGSLRFSLSRLTTPDDVARAASALAASVAEIARAVRGEP
jgi:cysteine desulfurase